MNEKMAPNNVAALLLIALFFSLLTVTTGGGNARDKARTVRDDKPVHVPTVFEKTLEEVLDDGQIRRRDDAAISQISTYPFTHKQEYLTAKLFRIEYRKDRALHVVMGIDTLFSQCSDYVDAHRREIAARFFIGYDSWSSGLVDKILIENVPVHIAIKYNYWHTGKEKSVWGEVVEEQTYAGRRELIEACGILPPELNYHGRLDLEEWRDK